jgi:N-acetylglucosamine kinase-like BadF-type ATPase
MSGSIHQQDLLLLAGVDVGGTQVHVAVLQRATLLARTDLLTGENPLPDRLLPRIYETIQQACERTGVKTDQLSGTA